MRRGGAAIVLVALLVALAGCDSGSGNDKGSTGDDGEGAPASVTVVSQNLLHGIACPANSDRCKLPQRVQLFARQLEDAGCPQVVAVQEVDPVMAGLLRDQAETVCSGRYELVGDDDPSIDREVLLTSLPVLGQERVRLAGPLRTALWARLRAPVGPLDVVATHLASSSDNRPCDRSTCPPLCQQDDTLNTCQGRQVAALLDDNVRPGAVGVLLADLNAQPGEPTIDALTQQGFVDTFLEAGNAECDRASGAGCTSGREDADLTDLTDPASKQQERIDYVFLHTDRSCRVEDPTGLFAAAPESPPLDDLVFASDHTGVAASIECRTTAAHLAAAERVGGGSSTTTTTRAAALDAETTAAITQAYETVFNGGGDLETRLGSLQDADQLRESFIARFEDPAIKNVVDQVRVRIDSLTQVEPDRVDVVYSILLEGAAVLDHVQGEAVRQDGRWLVSRGAYCQVATLGTTTVPEPCR